jgi:hypothetical protein
MKKILYVNGCSHSAGAEISKPNSQRDPMDLELSFGGQLAKKYKLIHHNDAIPGQGNDAILSQTIHSVLELLDIFDPEEILVVIGWAGYDRINFVYDNIWYCFCTGGGNPNVSQNKIVEQAYNNWIMTTDPKNNLNKFLVTYISMVNFLEKHKIQYCMFNGSSPVVTKPENNLIHKAAGNKPTIKIFNHIVNNENFLGRDNSKLGYYEFLSENYNPFANGRKWHFGPDAHSAWATVLENFILSNNPNTFL